eukprot:765692-Hanusia_phi.AAC.5
MIRVQPGLTSKNVFSFAASHSFQAHPSPSDQPSAGGTTVTGGPHPPVAQYVTTPSSSVEELRTSPV